MANTSGSINTLTITRDAFITDALQDLRVLEETGTPSAGQLTYGAFKLNLILKQLPITGILLWCRDTLQIPMQANKQTYTIGPVGADFTSYRPLRIFDGSFLRNTLTTPFQDTPLNILSRLAYDNLSGKTVASVVNSIYYDPQMAPAGSASLPYNPANAAGVLSVYNESLQTNYTVFLETQRPIQEVLASGDVLDMPLEWYNTLTKLLQAELADRNEVPEARLKRVKQEARDLFKQLGDWGATEQASMTWQPDSQSYPRGR